MSHYALFDSEGSMVKVTPLETAESFPLDTKIVDSLFDGTSNVADYRIFTTSEGPRIARSFMEIVTSGKPVFLPRDNVEGEAVVITLLPRKHKIRVSIPQSAVIGKLYANPIDSFKIHVSTPDFSVSYGSLDINCKELVHYGDVEYDFKLGAATDYTVMTEQKFVWYRMEVDMTDLVEISERGFIMSGDAESPSVMVKREGDTVSLTLLEDDIDLSLFSFANIMFTMKGDFSVAYGSLALDLEDFKKNKYFEARMPGLPDEFSVMGANFTRKIAVHENRIPFDPI